MEGFGDYFTVLVNILGGLAVFLYAMQVLGNNLQNVIGEKIELVLRRMTDKPYKGMVTGALVTFLTQSSSITVLTLIGLVNVGVLNLRQGVGIILGSEIGTTITAQLVTLKVEKLFFPIIIVGFVLANVVKNKNVQSAGKVIFSFGLLFMGMELLKKGAAPLKESEAVLSMFGAFGRSPVLGIIAGAVFTSLTSSSSATTSLVVALGAANVITLPAAIALILGANIGTCALELIASAGMSLTAKRVAYAQAVINILGVLIILPFVFMFSDLMATTSRSLAHQIANAHTVFNVASSVIFLFFVGAIVTVVKKLVPGEAVKVERGTKYIDQNLLGMPHIALVNATQEVRRAGRMLTPMLKNVRLALTEHRRDLIEAVQAQESQLDFLEEEIAKYLVAISERELDYQSSGRLAQLLHGVADIERAGDHINRISEQLSDTKKKDLSFSKSEREALSKYLDATADLFRKALAVFLEPEASNADEVSDGLRAIRQMRRDMEAASHPKWSKAKREVYHDTLHHVERLANHADSLAQIVVSGF